MTADGFESVEVARAWPYIERSVDRIVDRCPSVSDEQLHWRPCARGANSLAALAKHSMANVGQRLLGLLCGLERERVRDSEFEAGQVKGRDVVAAWSHLRAELAGALALVPQERVDRILEHPKRGPITGHDLLFVVAHHMAEHMGQAELTYDLSRRGRDD